MRTTLLLISAFLLFLSFALFKKDDPVAFRLFDGKGKSAEYSDIEKTIKGADVVLFGEFHNNPISHWLQLELTQTLFNLKKQNLVLAAEMFEADNQLIMNEYLEEKISTKSFESEMRLWPNYTTDYKPLVEFAREHKLVFVCANIPRRYANMVYKRGLESLDSLSADAKKTIAPLPIEYDGSLKCYADMAAMSGGHGGDNMPKSQAVKDATMAYFISQSLRQDKLVLHFNGAYHSDNYEGINWYLKKYKPGVKIVTISTVEQASLKELAEENRNKADFIIAVDEDMTKTH